MSASSLTRTGKTVVFGVRTTSFALLVAGCTKAAPAPADLSSLSESLFAGFEHPSDAVVSQMLLHLDQLGETQGLAEEAFVIEALEESSLEGLQHPGRDLAAAQGVGAFFESVHSVQNHTQYMTLDDLLPVAGSAEAYDRSFLEDGDPECFASGDCSFLRTRNQISRAGFGFAFEYTYFKDYRWVTESTSGEAMIVARGWSEDSVHGEEGQNHIWQWFDLEVWMPQDEQTLRYISIWTESEYVGLTDALTESMLISAIHDSFDLYEVYLDGQRR